MSLSDTLTPLEHGLLAERKRLEQARAAGNELAAALAENTINSILEGMPITEGPRMSQPRLGYWIANWNLSRAEAARVLGGEVDSMADTIGADVKPDLAPIRASSIRKVAGYVTGPVAIVWTGADWALFPDDEWAAVMIDQDGSDPTAHVGQVGDAEPGALAIAQAVTNAKTALGRGDEYSIYVSASSLSAVEDEVARQGLEPGEVVAYQWASPSSNPSTPLSGSVTLKEANVDLSVTLKSWHPIPSKPTPPPTPAPSSVVRKSVVTYDKATDGWNVHPGTDKPDAPGDHATVTYDEAAGPGWDITPGV